MFVELKLSLLTFQSHLKKWVEVVVGAGAQVQPGGKLPKRVEEVSTNFHSRGKFLVAEQNFG